MLRIILSTIRSYTKLEVSDKLSLNENQFFLKVQAYLQEQGEISSREGVALIGKSEATVRRYFKHLAELGLLQAIGKNKSRRYRLKNENSDFESV